MTEKEMIEIKHGSENMVDLLNQEQTELKKDMIEEMAEILGYSCGSKSMDDCNEFDDCDECRATDFYNAGYRKIPEGAVVLTRDEWEKYQITQRDWNAIYYDGIDKARKETAREFASFVKSKLFDLGNIVNERDIDDMLKEFFNENQRAKRT